MKPTGKVDTTKMHYLAAKVTSFSFLNSADFLPNHEDFDKAETNYAFASAYGKDDNIIKIIVDIALSGVSSKDENIKVSATLKTDNVFKIENLAELMEISGSDMEIDPVLGATLLGISFSTARGFLLSKLEGTAFQAIVLPIINPSELVKHQKLPNIQNNPQKE